MSEYYKIAVYTNTYSILPLSDNTTLAHRLREDPVCSFYIKNPKEDERMKG